MSRNQNEYVPDRVSPPGDTLLEKLETVGMSQAELAERTGRPRKTINEIVQGKAAITPDTALQLEKVLGVPSSFWNSRERHYREYLARRQERDRLARQVEWLRGIPVRDMEDLGWIPAHPRDPVGRLQEVLTFFGVSSPESWKEVWSRIVVELRTSTTYSNRVGSLAAWLRKGEIDAQRLQCEPYSEAAFRQALVSARAFTRLDPEEFQPKLHDTFASAGVAVVFTRELPGCRASGATRWLTSTKALIQLSLRYRTDDHLWFTFFHEAGHICLHGKRETFIEEDGTKDQKEREADAFACDTLIPPGRLQEFVQGANWRSLESIRAFAEAVGIAPGIIVGRLQHEGLLPFSHYNALKMRFVWKDADTD